MGGQGAGRPRGSRGSAGLAEERWSPGPVRGRLRYDNWPLAGIDQLYRLAGVVSERLDRITAPVLTMYSKAAPLVVLPTRYTLVDGVDAHGVPTTVPGPADGGGYAFADAVRAAPPAGERLRVVPVSARRIRGGTR